MKLVIFTLDAIFSLIVAVAGIGLLAYFFYLPQTATTLSYSAAASTFQTLLTTSIASIAGANPLYSNLTYQFNATNEVWDQYHKDVYRSGSNQHGPLSPSLSFIFNAGATPTNISADYGKIFFGAGNVLYAINATNGNLVWKKTTGSNIVQGPAIASGMLIYPNATGLTSVNPSTNALVWSSNGVITVASVNSPLLIYNNKIYFGAASGGAANDLAYYLNNGTNAWTYSVSASSSSLAIDAGSLVTAHGNGVLSLMNDFGSFGNVIWTKSISNLFGVSATTYNNLIVFPSGVSSSVYSANAVNVDGTVAAGFPISTVYQATQPAVYNNIVYYQTSNAVIAIAANGLTLWTAVVPAAFGTASNRAAVTASAKNVYTEWSNNYLAALNASTGSISWYTKVPTQLGTLTDFEMTEAYGRLYVIAGNYILAYGACNSQSAGSLLATAAAMYANGDGSCADALLDSSAPMTNYSIFLNNTFAPSISTTSFDGASSNLQNPTKGLLGSLQTFTVTGWVYVNAYNPSQSDVYSEGVPNQRLILQISSAGALSMSAWSTNTVGNWKTFLSTLTVPTKQWTFVAYTLSISGSGTFIEYLNSKSQSGSGQAESTAGTLSTGIGYNIGNSIGENAQYLNGNIANLQIYNSTLTATQVSQIYQGGIQGAPLRNSGLLAWYPLSGDTNDYGGLGNTAYPINVVYRNGNYLPNGYLNSFQVSKAGSVLPILNYTTLLTNLNKVSVVSWR